MCEYLEDKSRTIYHPLSSSEYAKIKVSLTQNKIEVRRK